MKILLADDHGLFVEGLTNLLQAGGYDVVGAASDGLEALQMARELMPDLILMDIRMPNCDGLKATRLIKTELPEINIVILTTSAQDEDLFDALRSGADGYLLKNLKPGVLFTYLEGLARGEAPLSRELSSRLLQEFVLQASVLDHQKDPGASQEEESTAMDEMSRNAPELTSRQLEILQMVARGLSYKEVGSALYISENTVKYHMGEILHRLHARNREQVVAYAIRTGLVSGTDIAG